MTMTQKKFIFFLTVFLILPVLGVFAQSGMMKELSGTVELKTAGAQNFVPAKAGDRISQDTVISTGFKSSALIEVGSAIITVRPLTCLTLKEIGASAGSENINMNLRSGRVRVELTPPAGTKASMSVSSPVATASVRGTVFNFDTQNLYVERGSVAFRGEHGGTMLINAGYWSYLDSVNRAVDPIEVRDSGLRPNAPVGSDSTGSANYKTETQSEAALSITPVYKN